MTADRRAMFLGLLGLALIAGSAGLFRGSAPGLAAVSPAEMRVNAPAGAQPLAVQFVVTTELSRFTPGGAVTTWGGYSMQLVYNAAVVKVNAVARAGTCGASGWALVRTVPTIQTGCAFQSSTSTGPLENITVECIAAGSSQLHLATVAEAGGDGSTVFDEIGSNITTDLVDSSVTCGTAPATGTPTSTPTPTLTPTFTPTLSPTPTATVTPGGPSPRLCTTNVGGPPTLGIGVDCDTDPFFYPVVGDGCVDSEDANPNDPWGFYSVPVPALLSDPNALRDNAVTAKDAQAVFRYFVAAASAGTPVYEQDLNQNGVKDGWEYDRSESMSGALGSPDGVVTIRDAQAAFAQFKAGVRCSSGYNMAQPLCVTNVGGPPTLGTGRDCDRDLAFPGVLGDGCVDSEDSNANDPWGFYSVPVPSLLADPNALRDNAVTVRDAQAVLSYFAAGAHAGVAVYEQDLNQNGVKDGWEYDRSPLGGGLLGPPDGVVTAQDAQAAFSQSSRGALCSSGYNMKNKP